jgi:hypothetical protein
MYIRVFAIIGLEFGNWNVQKSVFVRMPSVDLLGGEIVAAFLPLVKPQDILTKSVVVARHLLLPYKRVLR